MCGPVAGEEWREEGVTSLGGSQRGGMWYKGHCSKPDLTSEVLDGKGWPVGALWW